MTWQLQYNPNHHDCGEASLILIQSARSEPLRGWFGPLATHLAVWLQNHTKTVNLLAQDTVNVNKTLAQHLLVHASFHHQACLQHYQVNQDLPAQSKQYPAAMADVLLYIRMTRLHPNQQTLETLVNTQLPHCQDLESILQQLLQAQLIGQTHGKPLSYCDKKTPNLIQPLAIPAATH